MAVYNSGVVAMQQNRATLRPCFRGAPRQTAAS